MLASLFFGFRNLHFWTVSSVYGMKYIFSSWGGKLVCFQECIETEKNRNISIWNCHLHTNLQKAWCIVQWPQESCSSTVKQLIKKRVLILVTTDLKSTRSAGGHRCHGHILAGLVHSTANPSANALSELPSIQGLLISPLKSVHSSPSPHRQPV